MVSKSDWKDYYKFESKYIDNDNYKVFTNSCEDLVFIPKEEHKTTLIWLPGYKDKALSYLDDLFDDRGFGYSNLKVNILTAPKVIPNDENGYSWYKTEDRDYFKISNYEEGVKRIIEVIKYESELLNNDNSKIVLGGFSQGGLMSLHIGFSILDLGGIINCSGYMCSNTVISSGLKSKILICQGKKDNRIPLEFAFKSYEKLFDKKSSFNIQYNKYNTEHELTWEIYKDIKKFILALS